MSKSSFEVNLQRRLQIYDKHRPSSWRRRGAMNSFWTCGTIDRIWSRSYEKGELGSSCWNFCRFVHVWKTESESGALVGCYVQVNDEVFSTSRPKTKVTVATSEFERVWALINGSKWEMIHVWYPPWDPLSKLVFSPSCQEKEAQNKKAYSEEQMKLKR